MNKHIQSTLVALVAASSMSLADSAPEASDQEDGAK